MSKVDTTEGLSDLLRAAKITQRELARRMDMDPSAVSLLLRGRRKMQAHEAAQIASALGVSIAEVMEYAGIRLRAGRRMIPLVGAVDEVGEVHLDFSHPTAEVPGSSEFPEDTVAIQYRTMGSRLDPVDGWTAFFLPPHGVPPEVLGTYCVVRLRDGVTLLRGVRRGYRIGTFNLVSVAWPRIENAELEWAAPVLGIRT